MMARGDVSSMPTLLKELLDQAQRDFEAGGYFLPGATPLVVDFQNAATQIQRDSLPFFHAPSIAQSAKYGYSFI
jgi:hypothetical protein